MKKVLIAFEWLHMGGTEKFILDAIKLLPRDEYGVDLFLIHEEGPYLQYLPENVRLVCPFKMGREEFDRRYNEIVESHSGRANFKRKKFFKAAYCFIANRIKRDELKRFAYLLDDIDTALHYDIVIGASMTQLFSMAAASRISADRKFLWVHMPFCAKRSKLFVTFDAKYYQKYVDAYDGIVCVSNGIEQMVRKAMPDYRGFVTTIYNNIDSRAIEEKSTEPISEELTDEIKIVSVGRVVSQKGFDFAVDAARVLKDRQKRFVWYIIGDGKERERLTQRAEKLHLQDNVKFLGRRDNPFPYIRACDIYCQPSRFEAYCTTICEARVLKKPIVATDFTGIYEQVKDGVDGLIVQKNARAIAAGLEKMFDTDFRTSAAGRVEYPNANERGNILNVGYLSALDQMTNETSANNK